MYTIKLTGLFQTYIYPGVLKLAMNGLSSQTVQSAFRSTGMYPLNRDAIDRSQLIADTASYRKYDEQDAPTSMSLILECDDGTGNQQLSLSYS
jgi:hypothetical protein